MHRKTPPRGLIHALLLDGSGGCSPCPWDQVASWNADVGCLWMHFDFEEPESQNWLQEFSGLSEIAYEALISPETRPRATSRGDRLLLSLRGINSNPDGEPADMISLRLWTDGRRLISTQRRALLSTSELLQDLEEGDGPRNATELLVNWIDRITAHMNATIERSEDEVLALEDRILEGNTEGIRSSLAQLRKQMISIRRYLAPQREAMSHLLHENLSWLDELNRLRLREINDGLIRNIENLDTVRERAAMAQEEYLSRVSEQINARSYLFTVVATIFLPLTFFTGLLGINVGGMPGVDDELAFWIVSGVCTGLALALAAVFLWRKWF